MIQKKSLIIKEYQTFKVAYDVNNAYFDWSKWFEF